MATGTEFCLLGPLTVRCGGTALAVPRGRQRAVLAALLLRANRAVSVDELAEELWGADLPPSARVSVQNYVMRLRSTLGPAGSRIVTQPYGYLIEVSDDELDIARFETLLREARTAARDGRWPDAADRAAAALELWRGEPLADVGLDVLAAREAPRLAELRLQAAERRIDADLHLGRPGEVISELQQLTAAQPLRERLQALLMLALYRNGRQAEALAAYRQVRQVLVEELGTEPGLELQQLHQLILDADPVLTGPAAPTVIAATPAGPVPRQLPAAVTDFTGRTAELKALTQILANTSAGGPGTVVISAIGGTAGVGKTALALHWAHQVADQFGDGQLYVNLRGFDPSGIPATAAETIRGFLDALGVRPERIPPSPEAQAGLYRSLLSDKRMLIMLDNAWDEQQVRPLLPASLGNMVIVTSRNHLSGLAATNGARLLTLDVLTYAEALQLLTARLGSDRAAQEADAVGEMADLCACLPLALVVAAARAVGRPRFPLTALAAELRHSTGRLDALDSGDPAASVRAVFSWSYRHLDADTARTFRFLGLHPGPDLEPYAAATLTGTTVGQASQMLNLLARAHLIQPVAPGRYAMHDLLRAYACDLVANHDGAERERATLTRLFDYYLHTAAAAMDTLYPGERLRRPPIDPPVTPTPTPPLADAAAAQSWLDHERATLVAATVHTAERGWPSHASRLAAILFRYLNLGCHHPEAATIYTYAAKAAQRSGDHAAEAAALTSLGTIDWIQARYEQACNRHRRALKMFCQAGDRAGQARALGNLGLAYADQGRFQEAASAYRQALNVFRQIGDRSGEVRTRCNLGIIEERLGLYQQAASRQEQSLTVAREIGARDTEYLALLNLGIVRLRQGRCTQAADDLQRALALCREIGYRAYVAVALARIGDVCFRQGSPRDAADYLQEALSLFREIGDRSGEADALNSLGEVLVATSQFDHAHTRHAAALDLADPIGDKYEQARAHNGLGHAYHATGDRDQARWHWQQALRLFSELGCPEADLVRQQPFAI